MTRIHFHEFVYTSLNWNRLGEGEGEKPKSKKKTQTHTLRVRQQWHQQTATMPTNNFTLRMSYSQRAKNSLSKSQMAQKRLFMTCLLMMLAASTI